MTSPVSTLLFSLRISCRTPGYVLLKPPAKKPYRTAKVARSATLELRPQKRKTARVEPSEEMRITFVGARWSFSRPVMKEPGTDASETTAMRRAPVMEGRPNVCA